MDQEPQMHQMLQTDHPKSSVQYTISIHNLNQISSAEPWESMGSMRKKKTQVAQDLLGRDRYTGEGQAVSHDLIGRPGLRG